MPLIKSAIKRARQNPIRAARRKPVQTLMKTMIRKITDLTQEKKVQEAKAMLPQVYKAIDTAAKKRLIHRSNAARKKSLVARLVAAAESK